MERPRVLPFVLMLAVCAALCASAQEGKPVPQVVIPIPFAIDSTVPGAPPDIAYRTAEQMTEQDRLLEAAAESAISEKAGFADLEFNVGKWTYRQIVCPALPNHLFLGFTRNNGVGDVSLFSASIPRGGEGRVRVIPIQRRGYSLFSPAPINALTISAFNHIRAEEHSDRTPDWVGTALCYAALAGAHPRMDWPAATPGREKYPTGSNALMEVPARGGAIIRFTDVASPRRPMKWALTFNARGRLLKATHLPESSIIPRAVPPGPVDAQGRPIVAGARPVPQGE
jgi:hypothetical protein